MGVDDVRAAQGTYQPWRERVCGMAAQPADGAQRADPQAASLVDQSAPPTKRQQLAVDLIGQRARQLEWIALTAAE